MIEETVLDYLSEKIPVMVRMEEELDMPAEYILVEKTGGRENNHIRRATIAVQSYAGSLYRAMQINERVKEAMNDIVVLDEISRCTLNSDYDYTDTTRKKYRYQAVFDIVHY